MLAVFITRESAAERRPAGSEMAKDVDVPLTFWLLLVIKSASTLLSSVALALLEGAVSDRLRETGTGAELGRQKTAGLLGKVVLPIAAGFLVDAYSGAGNISFVCLFLIFSFLELVAAVCIWFSSLSSISEPQIPAKNMIDMLKNIELDVLLFTAFACGTFSGYLDHFALWRLEELGARMWLLALSTAEATLVSFPFIVLAEPIVKRLGAGSLVAAGLLVVGVKLFGYSLLRRPVLCLLVELCEPLVGPLFICAVLRYSRNITSKTSGDTATVLVATAHYGLGRGICAALVGALTSRFDLDFPEAAMVLGGCALACGATYYLFWYCCFKYIRQVAPQTSQSSQRSRWGSVRYLSFRRNLMRRASPANPSSSSSGESKPALSTIGEHQPASSV